MKLVGELIDTPIIFEENSVCSIVIENANHFYKILEELYNQSIGIDGSFVLSEGNDMLNISKNIELIYQIVPFDINSKKLISKIGSLLEKELINEENYIKTMELLGQIEGHLDRVGFIIPAELEYTGINVASLIKMANIKIIDDSTNIGEKVFNYMQLVRELDSDKLFVFVNLRSFVSDQNMQALIETFVVHKYNVLLLDCVCRDKLFGEKRLIIDKDLCEF